jgi:hypothetical protein
MPNTGFEFPVAVDDDWATLRRLWLDRVPDAKFTSASLLIDREGIVRHVHPGGLYARDASNRKARHGYEEMRDAILRLLAEGSRRDEHGLSRARAPP